MENTSKLNLGKARDSRLPDVLLAVDNCCIELGIDFYVLGALARDAWFIKEGIAALGTKDIDFAIMVSDVDQFYLLKDRLINNYDLRE